MAQEIIKLRQGAGEHLCFKHHPKSFIHVERVEEQPNTWSLFYFVKAFFFFF